MLRYGNTRELVLGLEVVLADGRVWDGLRGLRKDNTGYDLKQLFIGAEGTLGIVTAAVLKLFPAPRARATALAARRRRRRRRRACSRGCKQALGDRLVGFELMSALALALSRKHQPRLPDPLPGHPWYALVQADDSARRRAASPPSSRRRSPRRSKAASRAMPRSRSRASRRRHCGRCARTSPRRSAARAPTSSTTSRCRCRRSRAFVDEAAAALAAALPRRCGSSPSATSATAIFTTTSPAPESVATPRRSWRNAARANRIVHDLVAAHGGSISAEHGIGQLKRDELVRYKSAVELDLMRAVKSALDPARHPQSRQGAAAPSAA